MVGARTSRVRPATGLVHWPVRAGEGFVASWRALADLREHPGLRLVGVSNFSFRHWAPIVEETGVTPAVNQVELHPYLQQAEFRADHARRSIDGGLGTARSGRAPRREGPRRPGAYRDRDGPR